MDHARRRLILCSLSFPVVALCNNTVAAQAYPARPIRIIVPFAAGGTTDLLARILAEKMTKSMGVTVLVENRAGGNALIGTETVYRSRPDGYTLLLHTNNFTVNQILYAGKQGFDVLTDFSPISLITSVPHVLVVHPKVPAHTLDELVALAQSKPDALFFASAGSGTVTHLCGELFKRLSGAPITHVPYKGSGAVMADLLAGHVDMQFAGMSLVREHILAGRLRALAVTTQKRYEKLPDVPTIAEMGYPDYEFTSWFGMLAPAKTPPEIINQLQQHIIKIIKTPDVIGRLRKDDFEVYGTSPAQFFSFLEQDMTKSAEIIKASGAKVD